MPGCSARSHDDPCPRMAQSKEIHESNTNIYDKAAAATELWRLEHRLTLTVEAQGGLAAVIVEFTQAESAKSKEK